ncbi:sulfatase-like hydrolase/transferase [Limihaloglobus sulfuriphilus]|uniref:sulfatase-like hydrolase/transferase n=1 Tax=Limihaloglobus sulfuriphilus TaxID=1851148 RepID=UPI001649E71F|nr:sulfatase-like hydrolase/transferase [Limihaloglobus sulfuriphilus]
MKVIGAGTLNLYISGCIRRNTGNRGAGTKRPNIILIMADDLGYGDLSCYGNDYIKTPNIDNLAARGVSFTDYHSNGVVCSPTRAALLTGRYQQRCGIERVVPEFPANPDNYQRNDGLMESETTIADVLNKHYSTAMFGKWHLGSSAHFNPTKRGFEKFIGFKSGNIDFFSHVSQEGRHDWWHGCENVREEGYTDRLLTDYSLKFIEQHKDDPFFLYLPYEIPHYPYQSPGDYDGYQRQEKPEPRPGNVPKPLGDRQDTDMAIKEMIEELDSYIGEISAKLRQLNIEKNTFIFFCSDNGAWPLAGAGSNGALGGIKGEVFEGGHRVPAIACWPGKIKPGLTHQTAMSMDVFPTLLSITGIKPSGGLEFDGADLTPVLFENKHLAPRTLFWRYADQKAVRKGPWKLIKGIRKNPDTNKLQNERGDYVSLYNLDHDISESKDISAMEPEIVNSLLEELVQWEKDVDSDS